MKRTAVDSTVLVSVAYSAPRRLLEIELCSGDVYRYFDVPLRTYAELINADSKGRYFNANIRNSFRFQQINPASSARCAAP